MVTPTSTIGQLAWPVNRSCRSIRPTGFTLIEVVMVVLITGILAAVTVPRFASTLNRCRVEGAAKRIAADLNLARKMSMTKGGIALGEWVRFTLATGQYRLQDDPDLDHPSQEYWIDLRKPPYSVDLVSVVFTNEANVTTNDIVKFDMYGCANSGATPKRVVTGQIVVRAGALQKTVIINSATGEASVQ